MSRESRTDVEDGQHPFLKGQVYQFIMKQRGLKADDLAKEMHVSRAKMYQVLQGKGTEDQILALDRAITSLSDQAGGPLEMTGAGPDVAEGFAEVLSDAYSRTNGFGLGSVSSRVRRGTQ